MNKSQDFSQINTSPTKQSFSFGKDNRFKQHSKIYCDKFYEIPPIRSSRTTSIALSGSKTTRSKSVNNPDCFTYHLKSQFETVSKKGFSFGFGRDTVHFGEPINNRDSFTPGPSSYNLPDTKSQIQYSLKGRTSHANKTTSMITPGPGTYKGQISNQQGHSVLSNIKSKGNRIITPLNKNPIKVLEPIPGPGYYKNAASINQEGRYANSRWKNPRSISFQSQNRNIFPRKLDPIPGPGSYKLPSDFER